MKLLHCRCCRKPLGFREAYAFNGTFCVDCLPLAMLRAAIHDGSRSDFHGHLHHTMMHTVPGRGAGNYRQQVRKIVAQHWWESWEGLV